MQATMDRQADRARLFILTEFANEIPPTHCHLRTVDL